MTWLTFIAAAFAVYRAGRMVAEEDGPAFAFRRLRERFDSPRSSLSLGVRCLYCLTFWFALPAALLLCVVGGFDPWLWPVWWLGLAGVAVKIHEFWRPR